MFPVQGHVAQLLPLQSEPLLEDHDMIQLATRLQCMLQSVTLAA